MEMSVNWEISTLNGGLPLLLLPHYYDDKKNDNLRKLWYGPGTLQGANPTYHDGRPLKRQQSPVL